MIVVGHEEVPDDSAYDGSSFAIDEGVLAPWIYVVLFIANDERLSILSFCVGHLGNRLFIV